MAAVAVVDNLPRGVYGRWQTVWKRHAWFTVEGTWDRIWTALMAKPMRAATVHHDVDGRGRPLVAVVAAGQCHHGQHLEVILGRPVGPRRPRRWAPPHYPGRDAERLHVAQPEVRTRLRAVLPLSVPEREIVADLLDMDAAA